MTNYPEPEPPAPKIVDPLPVQLDAMEAYALKDAVVCMWLISRGQTGEAERMFGPRMIEPSSTSVANAAADKLDEALSTTHASGREFIAWMDRLGLRGPQR